MMRDVTRSQLSFMWSDMLGIPNGTPLQPDSAKESVSDDQSQEMFIRRRKAALVTDL